MKDTARLLKALGDESRLQIVALLLRFGELCVCDFEGALGFSQSKSSRHIRYLLNAGLLDNRRDGQWLHYQIRSDLEGPKRELLSHLAELLPRSQIDALALQMTDWLQRKACGSACVTPVASQ